MLRLTELKLPLDHAEDALRAALLTRLGIGADELRRFFSVFAARSMRAKRTSIVLIYTLDVSVRDEKALLARLKGDRNVTVAPDTTYRFVAHAPPSSPTSARYRHRALWPARRPRARPDGLFGRSSSSAARWCVSAPQDTWGFLAQVGARSGIERAVRRRRCRHVFGRQAVQPDQGSALSRPQGADRVRQGGRAGGDPLCRQAAYRHLPACDHRRKFS